MTSGVQREVEEIQAYKKAIIDYLHKQPGGTFAAACNNAKIPFSTAYVWRREDSKFNDDVIAARKLADDQGGDLAESKLMKKINDEDTTSILFYLKTKHKHRGYVERTEQDHGMRDGLKGKFTIDIGEAPSSE